MKPVKMPTEQLVALLMELSERVKAGDSFSGFVKWNYIETGLDPHFVLVTASYRVGNAQGQGGFVFIGEEK